MLFFGTFIDKRNRTKERIKLFLAVVCGPQARRGGQLGAERLAREGS